MELYEGVHEHGQELGEDNYNTDCENDNREEFNEKGDESQGLQDNQELNGMGKEHSNYSSGNRTSSADPMQGLDEVEGSVIRKGGEQYENEVDRTNENGFNEKELRQNEETREVTREEQSRDEEEEYDEEIFSAGAAPVNRRANHAPSYNPDPDPDTSPNSNLIGGALYWGISITKEGPPCWL